MQLKPILALLCVQMLFGALPVASKFVLAHAHPLLVVVARSLFATVFFFILHRVEKLRPPGRLSEISNTQIETHVWSGIRGRLVARIVALAFFGITFNQMALFIALQKTSAATAAIIAPSIALFTLLFSVVLGREKFRVITLTAILLGAGGVLCVVNPFALNASEARTSGEWWADGLNVLSAASYAFYLALVGRLPSHVGTFRFSFLLFLFGFGLNCVVLALYWSCIQSGLLQKPEMFPQTLLFSELPSSFWWALMFLMFGATALTYFLNTWALQRVKPSLVGGFVCLQALFGLVLSQFILQEPLTHEMIAGALLITVGVLVLAFEHLRLPSTVKQDTVESKAVEGEGIRGQP
jgi:drug/metabolite transporter (DMT)-like permease